MSVMRIELSTEPGRPDRPNEDFASGVLTAPGRGGALVVLDGVTPPEDGAGCRHGVPWYVATLGGHLLGTAASRTALTLAQCLERAVAATADAHRGACDLYHPRTPQATVVAVRWSEGSADTARGNPGGGPPGNGPTGNGPTEDGVPGGAAPGGGVPGGGAAAGEGRGAGPPGGGAPGRESRDGDPGAVEYLVLSDSVLLLDRGSRVEAVLDDRLDRLPGHVDRARLAVRALPEGSAERESAVVGLRRAVEALRNTEGGFFTAAADPSVAGRAVTGRIPHGEVGALAVLTDGAARLVQVFGRTDWAGALSLLRGRGPGELIARVRAEERADPDGKAHPRGKPYDDATAVLVEL